MPPPSKPPRAPWFLLAAMTLLSFGGPFLVASIMAGGDRPGWPPDRPVEWIVLVGLTTAVVILMAACLSLGARNRAALAQHKPKDPQRNEPEA